MSVIESNLSSEKYGYDMIVGTTQASINATMKQFLYKFDGEEFTKIYVYDANVPEGQSNYVETDYDAYKELLGFDPFDIPNDVSINDERIQKLKANFFGFGFKTKMGLPTTFPISSLPNIINLNNGNSSVSYNLYCKEFQIVNLTVGFEDRWENLSQEGEETPWTFGFTVDLDLYSNDSAFAHLPEEVQNEVKNLSPGSIFSVQQLYLNLNTAGLESMPEVINLEPTSNAYIYLTRIFLNKYFENIQENSVSETNPDGNYLLGYTIKPTETIKTPSVIPTDLNFMVSPYLDEKGIATKDYEMYTLNWLVMTNENKMPAPVQFEWNWIKEDDISNYHGVMSIKKGTFASFLKNKLSPALKKACIIPHCNVNASISGTKYSWGYKEETNAQSYLVIDDSTTKILSFNYSKKSNDKDIFIVDYKTTFNYDLQTDVYLEGKTIKTVTTATAFLYIDAGIVAMEGNCSKFTSTVEYEIGVDAYGDLTVIQKAIKTVDQSDKMEPTILESIATMGDINGIIDTMKKTTKEWMLDFMTGHQEEIISMLNGSGIWVFPGSETFVFKNAQFSNNQDLVSEVTYIDPVIKYENRRLGKQLS